MFRVKKSLRVLIILGALFAPLVFVKADVLEQNRFFFVDKTFDGQDRSQVSTLLKVISENGYFYVESDWYNALDTQRKANADYGLQTLASEFDKVIYPQLSAIFGSEWKAGIDNDNRITIVFHRMKKGAAGYFRTQDESPQIQAPDSNEREIIFLNADVLFSALAKSYLAHEFMHLVEYNQKDRLRAVEEEVWLNEARADYAPTLLGYNDTYKNSYLEQRSRGFVDNPRDPITEWLNTEGDYGALNIFMHYFVERYGVGVLADSLKSAKTGIASLDVSLKKYGFNKTFSQIFTDWTLAVYLNDCSLGPDYCFQRNDLKSLKVAPFLILAPAASQVKSSLVYQEKPWAGYWYKVVGGGAKLIVKVSAQSGVALQAPYILCAKDNACLVRFLEMGRDNQAELTFDNFNVDYSSLTLIPSIHSPVEDGEGFAPSFNVSFQLENPDNSELIEQLQRQLAELQQKIAQLRAQLLRMTGGGQAACQASSFEQIMKLGTAGEGVKCLQTFLAKQGTDIYPEGVISGFYGVLTQKAVSRFQTKYANEILAPLGITNPTGVVGPATLAKIKQML